MTDGAGRAVPVPARVDARVSGRPAGRDPALHAGARSAARLAARQPRRRSASSCCPTSARGRRSAASPGAATPPISKSCWRSSPTSSSTSASSAPTYVSLADRVQEQTGIPYALLDGRFDGIPPAYRTLGALIGRRDAGRGLRALSPTTPCKTITGRVGAVAPERRPRVYYARGPRGLETGLGGSINVETIELLGAQRRRRHARRACHRLDRAGAAVESRGHRHHRPDFAANVRSDPAWAPVAAVRARPRASVAEAAVRLGRFPAVGQPADRAVVAGEDPLSGAVSRRTCAR